VEFERRFVKSAPEVWYHLRSRVSLDRWLGEVRLRTIDPPHRLEWDSTGATGTIELEPTAWGTTVRVGADPQPGPAWERLQQRYALERSLRELLDELGVSTLKRR
jgi:hypothetical protein